VCLVLLVDDNIGEVEYPASPISHAQLQELRSATAKLRLNETMQQVDFFVDFCHLHVVRILISK